VKFASERTGEIMALAHELADPGEHGMLLEMPPKTHVAFLDTSAIHEGRRPQILVLPITGDFMDPTVPPMATMMPAANGQGYIAVFNDRTLLLARTNSMGRMQEVQDGSGALVAAFENKGGLRLVLRHDADRRLLLSFVISALKLGAKTP
jgi:hypothetical protein